MSLNTAERHQIERQLRRPFTDEELVVVPSVSGLGPAQREVLHKLALEHRFVAMMYLRGIVEGMISTEAIKIVDAIRSREGL